MFYGVYHVVIDKRIYRDENKPYKSNTKKKTSQNGTYQMMNFRYCHCWTFLSDQSVANTHENTVLGFKISYRMSYKKTSPNRLYQYIFPTPLFCKGTHDRKILRKIEQH